MGSKHRSTIRVMVRAVLGLEDLRHLDTNRRVALVVQALVANLVVMMGNG